MDQINLVKINKTLRFTLYGTTIVTYYITQRKLVAISCSQTSGHLFRISGVNLSSNLVQWNGATTMSTYPPIPLDFMIFQIYQKFKIIGESCFLTCNLVWPPQVRE